MRTFSILLSCVMLLGCSSSDSGTEASAADPRAQALAYATDDLPCATAADCCVVIDGCKAQGLIVAAKDQTKVAELLASAKDDVCAGCIPPHVQVRCAAGVCTGVTIKQGSGANSQDGTPFMVNHCGTLAVPSGWTEPLSIPIGSGPGLQPAKVLTCGS